MKTAGIIDCGCGNIGSLYKAIEPFYDEVIISNNPNSLKKTTTIFLPGSGSMGTYRKQLDRLHLLSFLKDRFHEEKSIVGICLGFQIFFEHSSEDGGVEGLCLIPGNVVAIKDTEGRPITRTGWLPSSNTQQIGLRNNDAYFYFNHSYGVPESLNRLPTFGATQKFLSWIKNGPLTGFQFHPEKSQTAGKAVLRNIEGL